MIFLVLWGLRAGSRPSPCQHRPAVASSAGPSDHIPPLSDDCGLGFCWVAGFCRSRPEARGNRRSDWLADTSELSIRTGGCLFGLRGRGIARAVDTRSPLLAWRRSRPLHLHRPGRNQSSTRGYRRQSSALQRRHRRAGPPDPGNPRLVFVPGILAYAGKRESQITPLRLACSTFPTLTRHRSTDGSEPSRSSG
jgi:hypothetical protein